MPIPIWKTSAATALKQGQPVTICPTGTSMQGIMEPGTEVTLLPATSFQTGDIVLAEIPRKNRTLLVLHKIWDLWGNQALVGNAAGRMDGWLSTANILGKVQDS